MAQANEEYKETVSCEDLDYGCAHLTAKDFGQCRNQLSGIVVVPFDQSKAKGVGYNFSVSEMIYSITRKKLVPICRDTNETYFYLRPHETVLALSYEYLKVDEHIAGGFHSRVRMTAQGVGSTSTTLDPGWNGMLLFSFNNPTKKKIKFLLSTREDGAVKQHTALTLVAWRTKRPGQEDDQAKRKKSGSLRLDNPPMRIDIWKELTAKPLRLFGNREYQKFSKLIASLSSFQGDPQQNAAWAEPVLEALTELSVAISSLRDGQAIQTALIRIRNLQKLPDFLGARLEQLTECIEADPAELEKLVEYCSADEYQKKIDLARREIQYLEMCVQIDQIHKLIADHVPTSWHKNVPAFLWQLFVKNLGVILATAYFFLLIYIGSSFDDGEYWMELALAFVPLILSVLGTILLGRDQ